MKGVIRKAGLSNDLRVLPLTLAGSNVTGCIVCAKATAAYTSWTVTSVDSEPEVTEVLWSGLPNTNT
jgi:hypothetical protein